MAKSDTPQSLGANPNPTPPPQGSSRDLKDMAADAKKEDFELRNQTGPKKAGRKILLTEEFMHSGRIYGPGEVEIEDEKVANDLEAAEKRVSSVRRSGPPIRPNGVMTGILPENQLMSTPNGLTPADLAEARRVSIETLEMQQKAAEAGEKSDQARTRPMSDPKKAATAMTP